MYLPDERIVFIGDLIEERMFPIVPFFPPMIFAGTVNLYSGGRANACGLGWARCLLCHAGNAGDLGPGLEGLGPGGSILDGRHSVAAEVEEVVDPVVGGEEALRLAG